MQQQTEIPLNDSQLYVPPLTRQVGGNHYKELAIQPLEFIERNGLTFCVANAIKYLVRHKLKNGKQDVEKAIHYCQLGYSLYSETKKNIQSRPLDEWQIIPQVFVEANKITGIEAKAFYHLCSVYSAQGMLGYSRAIWCLMEILETDYTVPSTKRVDTKD